MYHNYLDLIQTSTNLDWKQMYEIFNMGHRLEMYISPELAKEIINYKWKI